MVPLSQLFLSLKKNGKKQQQQWVGGVVVRITSLRKWPFFCRRLHRGIKVEIIVDILLTFSLLGLGIPLGSLCGLQTEVGLS